MCLRPFNRSATQSADGLRHRQEGYARRERRLFVEDRPETARQSVQRVAEPVLTGDEVSRRYNESARTVTRCAGQVLVVH